MTDNTSEQPELAAAAAKHIRAISSTQKEIKTEKSAENCS